MSKNVRVGLIGAGRMGLHHARSLAHQIPEADVIAVADRDEVAVARAADLVPGATVMTDHQALLADASIDAVLIAAPNDRHAVLIEEAAAAGKHIFCEKPLALNVASAHAAVAAVARHGVKLQIGFQRRFDAGFRRLRDAVQDGELGGVELVVCTTRDPAPPSPEYQSSSGGLFADTLIHDLDAVRFLTALRPVEVYAAASRMFLSPSSGAGGPVDTSVTTLRLETGALAVITNSLRTGYGYEVAAEVSGERGKMTVGQEQHIGVRRYKEDGVWNDHVYWAVDRFKEAYVEELVHFIDCVAHDREPEPSAEDGRAAVALAVLAERSHREGRPLALGVSA